MSLPRPHSLRCTPSALRSPEPRGSFCDIRSVPLLRPCRAAPRPSAAPAAWPLSRLSLTRVDGQAAASAPSLSARPQRKNACRFRRSSISRSSTSNGSAVASEPPLDVSEACVSPVFRSVPRPKEGLEARTEVRVLFVSEGNVCRSVYAEAVFKRLVEDKGLSRLLQCESKAVRDYNEGEAPDPLAVQVAAQCGLVLDPGSRARVFQPAEDIVDFDLIVVMDKFNAADVLKEVSVFDTIDPSAKFTSKVRRLGDFCSNRTIEDIDDPLYGNMGGSDELDNLSEVLTDIQESCDGLLQEILSLSAALHAEAD